MAGARTIQSLVIEDDRRKHLRQFAGQLFLLRMQIVRNRITSENLAGAIGFLGTVGMVSIGALLIVRGDVSIGGLVAFLGYAWRLPVGASIIVGAVDIWSKAVSSARRIQEVRSTHASTSPDRYTPFVQQSAHIVRGEVEVYIPEFRYPGRSTPALKDIHFSAAPGDLVCIVGPSGSGKSTLLALVGGFFRAEPGWIRIDGQKIEATSFRSLRKYMAIVLQDTFIWNGKVAENIRMGDRKASFERIVSAASEANAHECISLLPDGYNTNIGERGLALSGGERQRIGVARALIKSPSIILMDEPTSSVERHSEHVVMAALTRLSIGRTTLVASHRPIFAENASEVIFLSSDGEVQCRGVHRDLMCTEPLYREFMTRGEAAAS